MMRCSQIEPEMERLLGTRDVMTVEDTIHMAEARTWEPQNHIRLKQVIKQVQLA